MYGNIAEIEYGNGVHDYRKYGGPDENLRLKCIRTTNAPVDNSGANCTYDANTDMQSLEYSAYDNAGRLGQITDLRNGAQAHSNTQTATYDPAGRLSSIVYGNGATENFAFDSIGNFTQRGNRTYAYDSPRPHVPTGATAPGQQQALSFTHDAGGDRIEDYNPARGTQYYQYNDVGLLTAVCSGSACDSGGTLVQANFYDESGIRIGLEEPGANGRSVRYFGTFEVENDELVRYYFLGGQRVAMERTDAPASLALSGSSSASGRKAQRYAVAQAATLTATITIWTLLSALGIVLLALGRRRRIVAATIVIFVGASLPLGPLLGSAAFLRNVDLVPSAHALETLTVRYFHADQIGSPQILTDGNGAMVQQVRYGAYGNVRGVYSGAGVLLTPGSQDTTRTFTDHERDDQTGLMYMGARFYDAESALFLSRDPVDRFASPYVYAGFSPLLTVDPDGRDPFVIAALIALAAASVTFVYVLATTGDFGAALKAGAITFGTTFVMVVATSYVLQPLASWVETLRPALQQAAQTAGYGLTGGQFAAKVGQGDVLGALQMAASFTVGVVNTNAAGESPKTPDAAASGDGAEVAAAGGGAGSQSDLTQLGVADLQSGDVLLTGDGGMAQHLKGTGKYGHGGTVLGSEGERLEILSSDGRGIYRAFNDDPAVGGRTWDVFRVEGLDAQRLEAFAGGVATEGGLRQYNGNGGGNVCTSVCARALEAAGGPVVPGGLVTPNALGRALGPPIGRIHVPLLRSAP